MANRVTDSCTDADFVPVGAHIGELGAAYAAMIAPANPPIIFQNRICGLDAGNAIYLTSGAATTDGESVTATVRKFDATSCAVGPVARGDLAAGSCYFVFWQPDGTLLLFRVVGLAFTQIASSTAAISNGTHTVKLKVTGTGASVLLEIFVDGAGSPALSFTDSSGARLTSPGRFGVYLAGATGGGAGIHIDALDAVDSAAAAPTFSFTAPLNKTIHQRAAGVGTVKVSGTYTGAPATIEARLVAAGTNTPIAGFDWSTKVATPAGSAFSFTFAGVPESLGWREVQIRDSANPGTVFTSGKVAVGALFASANQSNVANFCYVGSSTLAANDSTSVYGRVGTWQAPNPATMDGAITFLNAMVAALGVVCGWLDTAKSGSGLDPSVFDPWLPTASSTNYAYFRDTIAALDGTVEGVISAAGENDANGGVSQVTFYADLGLLYSAIRADLGNPNLPIVMMTLGRVLIGGYATDVQAQAIRLAQVQKAADANIYRVDRIDLPLAGDNIHHTAAGYGSVAARCAQAMKVALGFATQYRGPSLQSAQRINSTTFRLTLVHHSGSDFAPTTGIGGWRFTDPGAGDAVIAVNSAVRVGATTVDVQLASAPVAMPKIDYFYGIAASIAGALKDNSALALPLEYVAGVVATQNATVAIGIVEQSETIDMTVDVADLPGDGETVEVTIIEGADTVSCGILVGGEAPPYVRAPTGSGYSADRAERKWLGGEIQRTDRLVVPPGTLAVSLSAARTNLRIDGTDQDENIEEWLGGIIEDAEHQVGRAFVLQGWRTTLDSFPPAIRLARSPLIAVSSVKFIDPEGVEQTLHPADYIVDRVSEPGFVVPADGKAWPETADRINAVRVEYTCGYGEDDTAVPSGIKLYILAKLAEQFDPVPRTDQRNVQSSFVERLLDRYKVYA